jgi:dipeptidyl aminopeptidase/acylaminoacyl peptidase
VPFDTRRLEVTGPAEAVLEGVRMKPAGFSGFALSASGALLYQIGTEELQELVWVSRAGGIEPVDPTWRGVFNSPALSPDGNHVAVAMAEGRAQHIWVKRLDRGQPSRLTHDARNYQPTWTPDGRSVTFSAEQDGENLVFTKQADGTGLAVKEPVPAGGSARGSADGPWLVYRTGFIAGDIFGIRPGRDSVPAALLATRPGERNPSLSPDGRWLAYTSDETGRDEVYVVPFPDVAGGKWAVSAAGGIEPVWSRNGRELFYRNLRREMVAVPIETQQTFTVGPAEVLFSASNLKTNVIHPQYYVSPDGRRFLMIRHISGDAVGRLILVQNFLEQLKKPVSD